MSLRLRERTEVRMLSDWLWPCWRQASVSQLPDPPGPQPPRPLPGPSEPPPPCRWSPPHWSPARWWPALSAPPLSPSLGPGEDSPRAAQPGQEILVLPPQFLTGTHHAALPVDGEETGAALQFDHAGLEVVAGDLEPETEHGGESVVVFLSDLLRPQVVISGLGTFLVWTPSAGTENYLLLVDEPGQVGRRVGLPGGTERLQALTDLIFLLDPRDPRLLIR